MTYCCRQMNLSDTPASGKRIFFDTGHIVRQENQPISDRDIHTFNCCQLCTVVKSIRTNSLKSGRNPYSADLRFHKTEGCNIIKCVRQDAFPETCLRKSIFTNAGYRRWQGYFFQTTLLKAAWPYLFQTIRQDNLFKLLASVKC